MSELRLYDVHFIVTRQQTRDFQLLFQRVEAVAGDAGDRDACTNSAERFGDAASSSTDVVVVHGFTECDVGVRVESSNELLALILKVRFDGVATAAERFLVLLGLAREPNIEFVLGPVTKLAEPSRERKANPRVTSAEVIVAARERGVGFDGADLERTERDLLGGRGR